jgi:hypothetical protein
MPQQHGNTRPHVWKHPNPYQHQQFVPFLRARSQAHFRKEEWTLTEEDWFELWSDPADWNNRGKAKDNVCLARRDLDEGWHIWNVEIITRNLQVVRNLETRSYRPRKPRKE